METIRIYAQINIKQAFALPVREVIQRLNRLSILPDVQLSSRFAFEPCESSDYSLIIMRELEVTREPQIEWFSRMIGNLINNTKRKAIIAVFSNMPTDELNERRRQYEQVFGVSIQYFDLDDWLPDNLDDLTPLFSFIQLSLNDGNL
jgi:hypothetical protein